VCVSTSLAIEPPVPYSKPLAKPSEQLLCLSWVMHSEAGGQGLIAMRAVADVIQTRMWEYKLTTCQVVAQKNQFSAYKSNMLLRVSKKDLQQAQKALTLKPVVKGATHFHNESVHPIWANKMKIVKKIGKHTFYKEIKK
jgi:spore germination cell wall hydrolase CwlJ-like protein